MPDSILFADPVTLTRSAIRQRLRAIADHERRIRRSEGARASAT